MRTVVKLITATAVLAAGLGCSAKAPLRTKFYEGEDDRTLLVLLPGFAAYDKTFEKKGLVDTLRRGGIESDVIAVNATYQYYPGGTLVDRMRADVIEPAREQGYEHIWVLGISMGGLGTLMTAKAFPDDIEGILLFSPFTGKKKTQEAIRAVGLDAWQPEGEADWDEEVWVWLKDVKASGWDVPTVYLAHGDRDLGMENMAHWTELLPEGRVHVTEGGHDWKTWDTLLGAVVKDDLRGLDAFAKPSAVPAPEVGPAPEEVVAVDGGE